MFLKDFRGGIEVKVVRDLVLEDRNEKCLNRKWLFFVLFVFVRLEVLL